MSRHGHHGNSTLFQRVERVIRRTLADLPPPIREALERHDVCVELLESPPDDVGPDTFGTFFGGTDFEMDSSFATAPLPPKIELYVATFADLSTDADTLDEEVRLTVIHEVGHFLGLEEEDLEDV